MMEHFERLKDLRLERKLSQADLAEVLGTTRQQIGKWELGIQMMGVDKYIKLAKYYNVSLDYLLGLTDEPRKLQCSPLLRAKHHKSKKNSLA